MNDTLNDKLRASWERDEAFFRKAWEGMSVPQDIMAAAERICRAFGINGVCDPGWIANVIAKETGRGDGMSHFTH